MQRIAKNRLAAPSASAPSSAVVGDGQPRLSVHRSTKHISAQLIDDAKGVTVAAASSLEKDSKGGKKSEDASAGRQARSPSAPRRLASPTSCSTAAATCSMAA